MGAITVDPRAGSADLFEPLKARKLPVRLSKLEAGDVAFIGNGPEGRPVPVGIEYKKLPEMLGCFRDRFAGHQIIGMGDGHQFDPLPGRREVMRARRAFGDEHLHAAR